MLILALKLGDSTEIVNSLKEDVDRIANGKYNLLLKVHKEHSTTGAGTGQHKEGSTGHDTTTTGVGAGSGGDKKPTTTNEFRFASGVIAKVEDDDSLRVSLDDGRTGLIYKYHCFDLAATGTQLFNSINSNSNSSGNSNSNSNIQSIIGRRVEKLLVISQHKGTLYLTMKPLLLAASKGGGYNPFLPLPSPLLSSPLLPPLLSSPLLPPFLPLKAPSDVAPEVATEGTTNEATSDATTSDIGIIPRSYTDFTPGQVVIGFIHKVEDFGILIKFIDSIVALVPRPNLADKFVTTPIGMFTIGDSIRCIVQRVDIEKERIILTCKSIIINSNKSLLFGYNCYFNMLMNEAFFGLRTGTGNAIDSGTGVTDKSKSSSSVIGSMSMPWSGYNIGDVVDCVVSAT